MQFTSKLVAGFLVVGGLAGLARRADAAEVYALLANGQGIIGTVPPGDPIRLRFPLSKGSSPTLSLALLGSPLTVSFRTLKLYGPDGQEIVLDANAKYLKITPHTNAGGGRDGLSFKGWVSTQAGYHELVITTNATTSVRAQGKLAVARPRKFKFQGDETSPPEVNPVKVAMQGDLATGIYEKVTLSVKRVSGTAPMFLSGKSPSGVTLYVSQTKTKKGSTSREISSTEFGDYAFTIGYQGAPTAPAVGKWKGVVTIKPFKGGYPATLGLRNSPGVALSVLDLDRNLAPTYGGTHVGVATDGNSVLVTSEGGGSLLGELFDQELLPPQVVNPQPVAMIGAADLPAGEILSGHRVMYMGGSYFAAVSSASGQSLTLARFNGLLQKGNLLNVVTASADPTADFFLAGDGARVSVGVFHPATSGHTVYGYDGPSLGIPTTVSIGGASYPQAQGAGAAWRTADAAFELWTPDTLDYRGPSKLHRVLYTAGWAPSTPDAKFSFADPSQTETMPTAVSVDVPSGVTIVHYVAADDPPLGPLGTGNIHRRLFGPTGVEIPGSHVVLPRTACNRPSSAIIGNRVFLAYDTATGPVVERYPLLRTKP